MALFHAKDATSGTVPAIHAGLNVHTSVYSLEGKTITGSQVIAMMSLPPGTRVRNAYLTTSQIPGVDGDISVVITTGDTARSVVIPTASSGTAVSWEYGAPTHAMNTYRTTDSAQVRILLRGTFSASVSSTWALTLHYNTDGDEEGSSQP